MGELLMRTAELFVLPCQLCCCLFGFFSLRCTMLDVRHHVLGREARNVDWFGVCGVGERDCAPVANAFLCVVFGPGPGRLAGKVQCFVFVHHDQILLYRCLPLVDDRHSHRTSYFFPPPHASG